jgi:hypothetical protein
LPVAGRPAEAGLFLREAHDQLYLGAF